MSVPIINGTRVAIAEMNASHIIDILKGSECYCLRFKRSGLSHCWPCFNQLPAEIKKALRCRVGEGFEDAYRTSLEHLARAETVSKDDLVFGPIVSQGKV